METAKSVQRKRKKSAGEIVSDTIVRVVLYIYAVVVLFPMIWTVYTSFKSSTEFYNNPWSLPKQWNFTNYISAFKKANMGVYFVNSIIITALSLLLIIIVSLLAAYAIARFDSKVTRFLNNLFMGGLFVPSTLILIPLFLLLNQFSLLDKYSGLIVVYVAFSLSFSIYVMVGFLKSIPKDYEEAAYLDGCSYFGALNRVMIPMAKPAIVTVAIFNFISLWNEYIFALVIISSDAKKTLPVGLANLSQVQKYSTDWGTLFAGLVIVMVPTIVFYALLQKKLIAGLNVGGLKG